MRSRRTSTRTPLVKRENDSPRSIHIDSVQFSTLHGLFCRRDIFSQLRYSDPFLNLGRVRVLCIESISSMLEVLELFRHCRFGSIAVHSAQARPKAGSFRFVFSSKPSIVGMRKTSKPTQVTTTCLNHTQMTPTGNLGSGVKLPNLRAISTHAVHLRCAFESARVGYFQ